MADNQTHGNADAIRDTTRQYDRRRHRDRILLARGDQARAPIDPNARAVPLDNFASSTQASGRQVICGTPLPMRATMRCAAGVGATKACDVRANCVGQALGLWRCKSGDFGARAFLSGAAPSGDLLRTRTSYLVFDCHIALLRRAWFLRMWRRP